MPLKVTDKELPDFVRAAVDIAKDIAEREGEGVGFVILNRLLNTISYLIGDKTHKRTCAAIRTMLEADFPEGVQITVYAMPVSRN